MMHMTLDWIPVMLMISDRIFVILLFLGGDFGGSGWDFWGVGWDVWVAGDLGW